MVLELKISLKYLELVIEISLKHFLEMRNLNTLMGKIKYKQQSIVDYGIGTGPSEFCLFNVRPVILSIQIVQVE
jgi:hypothetical protein